MKQSQIEIATDNGVTIICDQGTVIKGSRKGTYYIKAPNGHMVGLGSEQYGLNGTNFKYQDPEHVHSVKAFFDSIVEGASHP